MTLWFTPDTVVIYGAGETDNTGWESGRGAEKWSGSGSLDLSTPTSAAPDGGSVFSPVVRPTGRLHLPAGASVSPGDTVDVRGRQWRVLSVEDVLGPYTGSPIDETAATLEAGDWWP